MSEFTVATPSSGSKIAAQTAAVETAVERLVARGLCNVIRMRRLPSGAWETTVLGDRNNPGVRYILDRMGEP